MPTCPLCSEQILVSANERPDLKVDEHIRSGCQTHLLKEQKAQARAIRQATKHCNFQSCRNPNNYEVVRCSKCQVRFCLTHRQTTSHSCPNIDGPPRARRQNAAASRLLAKIQDQKAQKAKARESKTKRRPKKAITKRPLRSRPPWGDPKILSSDRFHLEIHFPVKPYDPRRANEYESCSMWFNKNHTVGRVLDSVCRHTNIENRNNQAGQPKLQVFHNRTGGQLPYDIPLHLLMGEVNPGDTIRIALEGVD
jgi:hypothetical protein